MGGADLTYSVLKPVFRIESHECTEILSIFQHSGLQVFFLSFLVLFETNTELTPLWFLVDDMQVENH